jgi:hypothetical protein
MWWSLMEASVHKEVKEIGVSTEGLEMKGVIL